MSEVSLPVDKGLNTGLANEAPGQPGFFSKLQNWVYLPDYDEQLVKIPGRTVAKSSSFPSGVTSANSKGLLFLKYRTTDKVLLYANSSFYEVTAGLTLGSFTQVVDKAAAAFARAGTYVKGLPDGRGGWIVWTDKLSENPLVRDEDGDWRFLGMIHPGALTISYLTSAPAASVRPDSASTPATCSEGTVDVGWSNTGAAFDGSTSTYALGSATPASDVCCSRWTFTDAGTTSGHKLYIRLGSSNLPIQDPVNPTTGWGGTAGTGGVQEPNSGALIVQISTTGATGTYTSILVLPSPAGVQDFEYTLPNGISWTNIYIQLITRYYSGTSAINFYCYEIYANSADLTAAAGLTAGTYYYAVSECYSVTLTNGTTIVIESPPCDTAQAVITGSEAPSVTGIKLTMPSQVNTAARGYSNDPTNKRLLYRKVYRSTKTGTWPDLGFITTIGLAETSWVDRFSTMPADTLGSPLPVIYLGPTAYAAPGVVPAFQDATIFKGAIVALPAESTNMVRWSIPGQPDYWPPPQGLSIAADSRGSAAIGITALNDVLVILLRTHVLRIRDLPLITSGQFDLNQVRVETLSPNEGLAGTIRSYCVFESEKGRSVCAWVSDSGIWMTDGSLLSEQGMGIVRLSYNLDWSSSVDVSRLSTSVLSFDPTMQALYFDFYDRDGNRRTMTIHTSGFHWINTGADQAVPKFAGPHTLSATDRAIGETGSALRHWSLDATGATPVIYSERYGAQNGSAAIESIAESQWSYLDGPRKNVHIFAGALYHGAWGASETADLDLLVRDDESGIVETVKKRALPLAGARSTSFWLDRAGQTFKFRLIHIGNTSSFAPPVLSFGPMALEAGEVAEIGAS